MTVESKGRVLVADDEPALLRFYSRVLCNAGYEVDGAPDGVDGAALFQAKEFDVVVSDLAMPRLDGIGLLKAVRARNADAPFVLITAGPNLESAIRAVEFGALRYLTKPVTQPELLEVVSRAVHMSKMAKLKRQAEALVVEHAQSEADRSRLNEEFDRALISLWTAFQPIVDPTSRVVFGYEALVRTSEPAFPHPGVLLSAAEDLGRLAELGRAIRARAARDFRDCPSELKLFVNLHPRDLTDDDLFDSNAPLSQIASRVVLEVTERAALHEVRDLSARLATLRQRGFKLAVDDLGAGYAGLSSLTSLQPEVVKIDMGITRDIHMNPTKQKLVQSLSSLCRELNIMVVAEGIESDGERDTVTELGCHLLQGYRFAKPGRPFPEVRW